jgi:hypothetical protein
VFSASDENNKTMFPTILGPFEHQFNFLLRHDAQDVYTNCCLHKSRMSASGVVENESHIQLNLPEPTANNTARSLTHCLDLLWNSDEQIACDSCTGVFNNNKSKKRTGGSKKVQFFNRFTDRKFIDTPESLVFILPRQDDYQNTRVNNLEVIIPVRLKIDAKFRVSALHSDSEHQYVLTAVVNRHGAFADGHYTTDIFNHTMNTRDSYDDSKYTSNRLFSSSSHSTVTSSTAAIIMYHKESAASVPLPAESPLQVVTTQQNKTHIADHCVTKTDLSAIVRIKPIDELLRAHPSVIIPVTGACNKTRSTTWRSQ